MFAFAVILWEMFTQELPWLGMDLPQMVNAVTALQQRPPIPPNCPARVAQLMRDGWHGSADLRPDFRYVINSSESAWVDDGELRSLGCVEPQAEHPSD